MNRNILSTVLSVVAVALLAGLSSDQAKGAQAQPVPIPEDPGTSPQIEIDTTGVGTLDYGRNTATTQTRTSKYRPAVDFSDSAVLLGAAQRLYNDAIGSFGLGGVTTDESSTGTGTSLFLHQAFLDYQSQSFEALVGRTDNPTAHLVDFPTLRGDDLITLTNPLDPFSNGQNLEEHRYSNVASATFNQNLTYFEEVHVQHLIDSQGLGTESGINSFGATFEYLGPPGMEALQRVPMYGLGVEHEVGTGTSPGGLYLAYAGGVVNLNKSVTDRVDLRAQDILSLGSNLTQFRTLNDTYQANANSIAASVRYLHSPFGKPGYQLALTAGHRDYLKVNDAGSWGWGLTGVKRVGQGFDVVAQYLGEARGSALAAQYGGASVDHILEVGMIINFNATFNQHLSPRRSLLNLQHQYIPD